ncbi:MAG: hypothetical protein AAF366_21605 [Pseudomonadota bacterium]
MRSIALVLPFVVACTPAMADIIPIEDVQRGQPVTVAGVVDRFHDEDEIRLRDDTGTLRVYLGPQPLALDLGDRIQVSGFMDDDLALDELYAREIVTADGAVIAIDRRYE